MVNIFTYKFTAVLFRDDMNTNHTTHGTRWITVY